MSQILLVEDDAEICRILEEYLARAGHRTVTLRDGLAAEKYLAGNCPDLILLDLMLPYLSGEQLLAQIRQRSSVPVIVLSAKDLIRDKVALLRSGADDYITKPFDLSEVAVRIETVLRRAAPSPARDETEIRHRDIVIDRTAATVTVNGTRLSLTVKEYRLLSLLAQNPNRAYTKYQLYQAVWDDSFGTDENSLNAHISTLRKKLKEANPEAAYIETLYGIGYRMN